MTEIPLTTRKTLTYHSLAMAEAVNHARRFASSSVPVLITGESGTGKELIARLLHEASDRKGKPFVAINCAAIPADLIESELFGHQKGAFTGADSEKIGVFEEADHGTLFLDEIGEMPPQLQARLLRVIQEGKFRRLGGNKDIEAAPRIISATNRDPEKALRNGSLRSDLYYRLAGMKIHLPPLRERREDIPLLANYYVEKAAEEYKLSATPHISAEAMDILQQYDWPGNVRELVNAMTVAVILSSETGVICPEHLRIDSWQKLLPSTHNAPADKAAKASSTATNAVSPHTDTLPDLTTTASVTRSRGAGLEIPEDGSFGDLLSTHRENRGMTQTELAEAANRHSHHEITTSHINEWESNQSVPPDSIVNTLAYVLIITSRDKLPQKLEALTEFFAAADRSRGESTGMGPQFGDVLKKLRERQKLTPEQLAQESNKILHKYEWDLQGVRAAEFSSKESPVTQPERLSFVRALDSEGPRLSAQERMALFKSGNRSSKGIKEREREIAEDFMPLKEELIKIMEVKYGPGFQLKAIEADTGVSMKSLSVLLGRRNKTVPKANWGLGDELRDKLDAALRPEHPHAADEFLRVFEQIRQLTGYYESKAIRTR